MTRGIWERMPRVVIGIPTRGKMDKEFIESLLGLQKPQGTQIVFDDSLGIQRSRRTIVDEMLKWRADYLFFVDDDVVLPPDALVKLMQHGEPIVAGWYPMKRAPIREAVWVDSLQESQRAPSIPLEFEDMLVPTEVMGLGCCLIKSDVFREIDPPYFYYSMHGDKFCPLYDELTEEQKKKAKMDELGSSEDFNFIRKVRSNGYEALVDPSIKCGHIGQTTFRETDKKKGGQVQ